MPNQICGLSAVVTPNREKPEEEEEECLLFEQVYKPFCHHETSHFNLNMHNGDQFTKNMGIQQLFSASTILNLAILLRDVVQLTALGLILIQC